MDNSTWQAHPQAPFSHYSPQPGGHPGYPNIQNGTLSSSPVASAPTLQQSHQTTSNMLPPPRNIYGHPPVHRYPNNGTPVNNQWPTYGRYGVPAQQAHGINGTAGPQMYNYPVNGNGFPQDVQIRPAAGPQNYNYPVNGNGFPHNMQTHPAAGPQMYNYPVNGNGFPQNVQSHPAAGAHPGLHLNVLPLSPPRPGQTTSQSTLTQPPATRTSARQVPQPRPQTRYNLPQLAPMPPPNDDTPGDVHHNANVPVPSTQPPATPTSGRRPAGEPLPESPAKRQRPAASHSAEQHPRTVANASQVIPDQENSTPAQSAQPGHSADQPPQPVAEAHRVIPNQGRSTPVDNDEVDPEDARLIELIAMDNQALPIPTDRVTLNDSALTGEPEHLPEVELRKISTRMVIEPDSSEPPPKDRTVFTWAEAVAEIMKILDGAQPGHILRKRYELEQLTDTVEKFIARPGRRALSQNELEELLTIRYGLVTEDYIALCYLDLNHVRDYASATNEKKQRVVRKVWEMREKERWDGVIPTTRHEIERDAHTWFW